MSNVYGKKYEDQTNQFYTNVVRALYFVYETSKRDKTCN